MLQVFHLFLTYVACVYLDVARVDRNFAHVASRRGKQAQAKTTPRTRGKRGGRGRSPRNGAGIQMRRPSGGPGASSALEYARTRSRWSRSIDVGSWSAWMSSSHGGLVVSLVWTVACRAGGFLAYDPWVCSMIAEDRYFILQSMSREREIQNLNEDAIM
jgi:hypothetical protein